VVDLAQEWKKRLRRFKGFGTCHDNWGDARHRKARLIGRMNRARKFLCLVQDDVGVLWERVKMEWSQNRFWFSRVLSIITIGLFSRSTRGDLG
jgi:hypothetical protein